MTLKEKLVKPSLVRIKQRKPEYYELQIIGFYNVDLIRAFAQKHDLTIDEEIIKRVSAYFQAKAPFKIAFAFPFFQKQPTRSIKKIKS